MKETAGVFERAAWDYWRNVGAFLVASGLLGAPLAVLHGLGGEPAAPGEHSLWRVLPIVELVVSVTSSGAVALLAFNVRAGGAWGWREAWGRVADRLRPLVTSHVAALLACLPVFIPSVIVSGVLFRHGTPRLALEAGRFLLTTAGRSLFSIVTFVAVVDGIGWFKALGAALRICRERPRALWPLVIASALWVIPVFLLGTDEPARNYKLAAIAVSDLVLRPFLMLVALSFYWDARDLGGAGAEALAAVVDAKPSPGG